MSSLKMLKSDEIKLRMQAVQFWLYRRVFWREWMNPRFCRIRKFDLDDYLLSYDPDDIEFVAEEYSFLVHSCVRVLVENGVEKESYHFPLLDLDFPVEVRSTVHGDRLLLYNSSIDEEVWCEFQRLAAQLGIGAPVLGKQSVERLDPYRSSQVAEVCFLDMRCDYWLKPSSTPGHFHLYIRKELSWPQYKKMLALLGNANVLEKLYVEYALRHKATLLVRPGISKENYREHCLKMKGHYEYR